MCSSCNLFDEKTKEMSKFKNNVNFKQVNRDHEKVPKKDKNLKLDHTTVKSILFRYFFRIPIYSLV